MTQRLNIILGEQSSERLERLLVATKLPSRAAVVRRALSLYEAVIEEQGQCSAIRLRGRDGKPDVLLEFI